MPSISRAQPLLCSREQSRSSSFLSHAQRSLLALFASLTDRNLPFTVRRSRKGNSQVLQALFYCLCRVQSLLKRLRRGKVM